MQTIILPHGFEPNYTVGFVKGLRANGIDLCVISSDLDEQRLTKAGIPNVNLRGPVTEQRNPLSKAINLLAYYAKLSLFLAANRRPTLHFTGTLRNELVLLEGIVLFLTFRVLSSRFLYTAHNALPHGRCRSRVFHWIYRIIYCLPHAILVHTAPAAQQISRHFAVPPHKIHVISIGLNEEVPVGALTDEQARQLLRLAHDDRVILFFGKIEPYKGLDILLDAFDTLSPRGLKLLIAGSFQSTTYRQAIVRQIDGLARRNDIIAFLQHIPNEEVERFFKSADALILPYREIYQSGLLFLSMRFGTPVIATAVGALPEYIGKEIGIVTNRNDATGLKEAIALFFQVQAKYCKEEIIASGQKYRWENICKKIVWMYK